MPKEESVYRGVWGAIKDLQARVAKLEKVKGKTKNVAEPDQSLPEKPAG